jgi:outer membrane receptor protein involved in Fe transport
VVGGEYGKTEPIWQKDRDWAFPGVRRTTATTAQPVQFIVPASRSNTMPTATFQLRGGTTPASVSIALDRSQVFTNTAPCASATVNFACQDPWLFYTATYNALQGQDERQTLRTYVDFELANNLKVFADLSYGRADALGLFQPAFSNAAGGGLLPVALHGDNAFMAGTTALDAQMRTAWQGAGLAFNGTTTANVGKFWNEFGRRDAEVVRENYRAVTGLEGNFDAWNRNIEWDFSAQYGELDGYTIGFNVPNDSRVVQQTDAVVVNGQVVCRSAAAQAAGCVPWDLINGPSAAAIAWSNAQSRTAGVAQQTVIAANATTSLFDMPAGAVGIAGGLEYRRERSQFVQDALGASGALFYNAIGRGTGEYNVKEAYVELSVPLLKDLPFAHRLSVELAGREGDYSTVGSVNQWRVQTTWAPVQDVSFRGALSSAVRAPNITELFAPQSQNFTTAAVDPCDRAEMALIAANATKYANRLANCTAAIPGYSPNATTGFQSNIGAGRPSLQLLAGGNSALTEETADTTTVGAVFKPRWVPDLLVSIDYWHIKVDQAINVIPINALITNLCYDAVGDINANRFCTLVERDSTGATTGRVGGVIRVVQINQNVQSLDTSGIDVALSYGHDLGDYGRASFRVDATRLIRWDLQGGPGIKPTHFAGVITNTSGTPNYKGSATLGYSIRNLSVNWQTYFVNSFAVSEVDAPSARSPFFTGDYWSHDLRATYRWNDSLSFRAGILNLFNEHPPIIPEVGNATGNSTSTYDNRGRWYFLGANYSFAGSH